MSSDAERLPIARVWNTDRCCYALPSRVLCSARCPLSCSPAKGDSKWMMKARRMAARPISPNRKVYTMKLGHRSGDLKPTMELILARADYLMKQKNGYSLLKNNCEHCTCTRCSLSPLLNVFRRIPRGDQLPPLILQRYSAH